MTTMQRVAYGMLVGGHSIEEIRRELRTGDVTCSAVEDAIRFAVQREHDEEAARECRVVRDLERGGCGE